jgi:hypothetical protein
MTMVPITTAEGMTILLSSGEHCQLIRGSLRNSSHTSCLGARFSMPATPVKDGVISTKKDCGHLV